LQSDAENFIKEMKSIGQDAWIVGDVVKGENKSIILENSKIIEVLF